MMQQYVNVISRSTLPPHIFAISDAAFSSLCSDDCSQCCVISGESGAGKSVVFLRFSSNFGGVAEWIGRQSLAGGVSLMYA